MEIEFVLFYKTLIDLETVWGTLIVSFFLLCKDTELGRAQVDMDNTGRPVAFHTLRPLVVGEGSSRSKGRVLEELIVVDLVEVRLRNIFEKIIFFLVEFIWFLRKN